MYAVMGLRNDYGTMTVSTPTYTSSSATRLGALINSELRQLRAVADWNPMMLRALCAHQEKTIKENALTKE